LPPVPTEHFIPFRKSDIVAMCLEDAVPPPGETEAFKSFCAIIQSIIHYEFHARLERLKDLYAPFDPTADTRPLRVPTGPELAARQKELVTELEGVLAKANYARVSQEDLNQALREESVFRVQLHTDLGDFAELIIHARSLRTRTETISSLMGLKKRAIAVAYYERVALYVRFQDEAHFAAKLAAEPKRAKDLKRIAPGATVLKLFQNIPKADLEMLFPNVEVRMKLADRLMIGGTALLGAVGILLKLSAALFAVWIMVAFWLGMGEHPGDSKALTAQLIALGLGLFTLTMYVVRQLGRIKNRKIQFMKALADSLYFQNLDNNSGVFHHLVDAAEQEECKEEILGYAILLKGAATLAVLDARIEAWFRSRWKVELDFEVDDALGKLERLGLARRDGETWTATPLAGALGKLDERWDAFFQFAPAAR
jgi:hypothetical protein